ncbi:MAG: alpha/beta hydrolase [Clostridiales Family XIII bacterium]|nr:alpha/beta hydrolase [Clostridiales Family XIII bacterium]
MPYFTTSDNVQIYYEERGKDKEKTIIFIHGWASDHSAYHESAEFLKKWYHCVSFDLRGCGASSRPRTGYSMAKCARDMKELIEELELENVALFGASLGTSVIYAYVRDYGCRYLDRVILADMPPRLIADDSPEHPWKWGLYRGDNTGENLLANMGRMFEDFDEYVLWHVEMCMPAAYKIAGLPDDFRQAIGTEALPPEARDLVSKGLCRDLDPLAITAFAYFTIYEDYRDVLPSITVPAAVFYPNPGSIYVPEAMEYVADHVGGPVRKVEFKPATHMFLLEHKERSMAELIDFMEAEF